MNLDLSPKPTFLPLFDHCECPSVSLTPHLSAEPQLTPLDSRSELSSVLLWGLLRWFCACWTWALRPQNWAQGGQKRPSPAPVSSSKSHRSCRKVGCRDVKWHSPCPLPHPLAGRPLPAPGPAGSAPSVAARWAVPGRRGRLGPLAPGEVRWNQTPQRPALSETVPCAPHLPQGSLELV